MPRPLARRLALRALALPALLAATLTLAPATTRAAAPAAADPALAREKLTERTDINRGVLPNGLAYIIKQHKNPPTRVSIWMHVSSGSLNESDPQRGLAHFLEHMAFNGSKNYPPGSLVPFFESLGLTFGRHQNAFTSFDQTVYQIDLPDISTDKSVKALTFFADVLRGLLLDPAEIDNERPIILEEKRTGAGAQQRILDQVLPRIVPGSRVASRLPIGVEETLNVMGRAEFVDYYNRWYTTGNATLIIVGDIDPAAYLALVKDAFGAIPAQPRPADEAVGVTPYTESFAVVATDAEYQGCEVAILDVGPPTPPTRTAADFRRDLVQNVANFIMNRRFDAKVKSGAAAYRSGSAFSQDLFSSFRLSQASATGEPDDWRRMLDEMAAEVQRARTHGFTQRELDDARAALSAQIKQFATMESTIPARFVIGIMAQAVNDEQPVLSAAQQRDLMDRLLPTITAEEVSAVFADAFSLDACAFVMEANSTASSLPTEAELLAAGLEALARPALAEAQADRPDSLMSRLPEPGKVDEMIVHPETDVLSAWLANGVRAHHRFMDYRENDAAITITLAGGRIQEDASNHGVTDAALLAFQRPATKSLTSTNVRDLLVGKNVSVIGFAGPDFVRLVVRGAPEDLETGAQLAHLLLTQPVIEQPAFDQWRLDSIEGIKERKTQPRAMWTEVLMDAVLPDDEVRPRPLEVADIERQSLASSQAWLDRLVRTAPIEIAVVGDLPRQRAMEIVERYFGSLPQRERISDESLASLRTIERVPGPAVAEVSITTQTDQAMALAGFRGINSSDKDAVRRMRMAAQILTSRMIKRIREDEGLVYSISAMNQPATAYRDMGFFGAGAPCDPANADRLAEVVDEMLGYFAAAGPTDEEMSTARKQIANTLDEQMKEPAFWTEQLGEMSYRGDTLDEVVEAPAAFQNLTPEEIRETFQRHYGPDTKVRVIVRPAPPSSAG